LLIHRELTDCGQIEIGPRYCDRPKSEKCRSENKDAFSDRFHDDWVKQFNRDGSADKERLNICWWLFAIDSAQRNQFAGRRQNRERLDGKDYEGSISNNHEYGSILENESFGAARGDCRLERRSR
jgi:hypothetical protein